MKTCNVCGKEGGSELFYTRGNVCRECTKKRMQEYYSNNREKRKERQRQYRKDNPEKVAESHKRWRDANHEELLKKKKDEYRRNKPKYQESAKAYKKNNREKINNINNEWRKTPKGKENERKKRMRRRGLGHCPINEWFRGSVAHHLRYSTTSTEQDNNLTIYVPAKLHRSIKHNGRTGENMKAINMLLLEWYVENTPEEQRNPLALQLLKNYKEFPEPVWKQ